jgi:hypothetical protein
VPERVTSVTAPPESFPYSAERPLVSTLLPTAPSTESRRNVVEVSRRHRTPSTKYSGFSRAAAVDAEIRAMPLIL